MILALVGGAWLLLSLPTAWITAQGIRLRDMDGPAAGGRSARRRRLRPGGGAGLAVGLLAAALVFLI